MNRPLITVMVIDHDPALLAFMSDALGEEGYRTICRAMTTDAFALVADTRPDLMILDLWVETREAGWELLEHLRRDPRTTCIPILVCSADRTRLDEHADLLQSWRCPVLDKPFDLAQLLAQVSAMTTAGDPGNAYHVHDID